MSLGVLAVLGSTLTACGGSNNAGSSMTSPSVPGPQGPTFTVTAAGVSPKSLAVSPGSQVTFVNNDTVVHLMFSDPHPEHTDCPEINQVGNLSPGQSRQTGNLNAVRTCGFHDHERPLNTSLLGDIVIR